MAFTFIVVKKYAWRPLELTYNYPLRTIDDKGTGPGHNGESTKINLLFLNIPDALHPALLVDVIGEQPDHYFHGRLIRYTLGKAFPLCIFRLTYTVLYKLKG